MRVLKARLLELQRQERDKERDAREAEKKEIAWGSQIRSYVLQPYQKVKDHRTDLEEGNVQRVLDGDLDPFIEAYLLQSAERKSGTA
jgi:peptide chain release factor 2